MKTRIPRKIKKKLKKEGLYQFGLSLIHCMNCQKKRNGWGYDLWFCEIHQ